MGEKVRAMEREGAVKQIGPMGASERTKAGPSAN